MPNINAAAGIVLLMVSLIFEQTKLTATFYVFIRWLWYRMWRYPRYRKMPYPLSNWWFQWIFVPFLMETKLCCRVSSVLGKDVKSYGKQFLFDGLDDTCWNSDQVFCSFLCAIYNLIYYRDNYSREVHSGSLFPSKNPQKYPAFPSNFKEVSQLQKSTFRHPPLKRYTHPKQSRFSIPQIQMSFKVSTWAENVVLYRMQSLIFLKVLIFTAV